MEFFALTREKTFFHIITVKKHISYESRKIIIHTFELTLSIVYYGI